MKTDKIKIIGFTFSITWIMFIALALFISAIREVLGPWFTNNAGIIAIFTGIIVTIGIIIGAITITSVIPNR